MTQFSIGSVVFEQIRGSPPLSPALCLTVVALSEEVWFRTYATFLTYMDLSSRFPRYVDNRLCLVDPSWHRQLFAPGLVWQAYYFGD